MHKKKNKRSGNKVRLANILIIIAIICICIFIAYKIVKLIIEPTDILIIEQGTILKEESVIGYIIREEKIIEGQDSEQEIVQIKLEGEKTAKGEAVFRYNNSNQEKIESEIEELNTKIQEAISRKTRIILE